MKEIIYTVRRSESYKECYKEAYGYTDEDFRKYSEIEVEIEIPELTGTEKQINWAHNIIVKKALSVAETAEHKIDVMVKKMEGKTEQEQAKAFIAEVKKEVPEIDSLSDYVTYMVVNNKKVAKLLAMTKASDVIDSRF